jgi:hypothetical protein
MFKFSKLREGVYELRFDDLYELCMTFLRYQEFYESPRYQDRKFTLAEYMSWYVKAQNKDNTFTYPSGDWGGFNIPAEVIGQVHALGIDDPNHYDLLMLSMYRVMMAQTDRAYLIGVQSDVGDLDVHEMTHAMYYLDEVYRNRCLGILNDTDPELIDAIRHVLFAKGYTEKTLFDEIQAYLTSGTKIFNDTTELKDFEAGFQELQAKLKVVHVEHYSAFTKDIKPISP